MCFGGSPIRFGQFARTRSKLPPMPPDVTSTAGACSSNSPTAVRELGAARGTSDGSRTVPRTPSTTPSVDGQLVHLMPEREAQLAALGCLLGPRGERRDDPGAGAPGDVEARDGVAVPGRGVAAALGPADDREPAHAALVQPGALLAGGEVDVRLGPAPRPDVLVVEAVEAGGAQPVLPGELDGVLDPHPALLGRVDEEQPAERPEGLPAEILLRLLIDQDDPPAGVEQLARRDQPGEARTHHDRVGVHTRDLSRAAPMLGGPQPPIRL